MCYEKQTVLTRDENPFGGKDYDVDPFMVGDLEVLSWKEEDSRGVEGHSIRPAYSASSDFAESGGRCWYHVWNYEATERGNRARGCGAELMSFREGVDKLVERDVFSFPLPESEYFRLGIQDAKQGRAGRVVPKGMAKAYQEGYDSAQR